MNSIETHFEHANGDISTFFPAIIELYLEKNHTKTLSRSKEIINKRHALSGNKFYTLEDLGQYFDITRERIRQIEAKILKELRELLNGSLKTKAWKLHSKLVDNYNEFKLTIDNKDHLILKADLESTITNCFGSKMSDAYLNLFMEISGYIRIPKSYPGFRGTIKDSWFKSSKHSQKEIESSFKALDICFQTPKETAIFDIVLTAKKGNKKVSSESIHSALKVCEEIETTNDNAQVKFVHLKSAADKAHRILQTQKKPIHYAEIAKEINFLNNPSPHLKPIHETNLKNQLVADKRFLNIGKSGEWALLEWNSVQNITILEAIEKTLHQAGKTMSIGEVIEKVSIIRPDASERSIRVYLNTKPEKITLVNKNEYGLAAWKLKAAKRNSKPEKADRTIFYKIVKQEFSKGNTVTLPHLIQITSEKLSISAATARQMITKSQQLRCEHIQGQKAKTVFLDNPSFDIALETKQPKLLRDTIQDEIALILHSNPNISFKKGELYDKVSKSITCKKSTFYRYLQELSKFKQYTQDNDYLVVFEHQEDSNNIAIDLSKYSASDEISGKLFRAISKLNQDEVDIALFELGVIFENELKAYITKEKNFGKIKVTSNDTSKLVNMINWVVENKIMTKGYYLNILREERNDRAHGEILSTLQRHELFNKAYYLSELFIKYIIFFNNLTPTPR